ncbi:bifunctional methylenetetrahydrofolate dehydrogenase/methenyltetrahydrofolate cyclohydrolase FolD [Leptospira borgpetersenii]|uniref:Bifunctional protein FolD n=1 Tax=Leptospira borgpetersenii serovar Ballum TaxID=280505 RepID=A0A0E3B6V7_LEPBO|nr:bifunctional methylenetetrahydrofolate dehydrogenase/methenyltetrahydrofolate cyclohydrolase FolD [Leptospira borgpetersenii]EMO07860.1 tetrahydrofolate dehydrogenase/cyclohydrolase, NAD(P)-binding domain protein [Leptospira borgpetersenii str. Noumea 25]ALO25205.1 tetrahydrofolate dehydrogenase/cyclohydrolase, NAD(P)-binding domain protein [Leptospira borgpetersenii serovar Ballum]ANH00163.2 Bifunctional protein FolD [Leptospira borgpetersenii str. 4E]EKQ98261.1 tetrahydrofolate dehydrogena
MDPILLDGKKLSEKIRNEIRREIEERKTKNLKIPKLATILVGNNPASETYVSMKIKACHGVGMGSEMIRLGEQTTTEELLSVIDKLNADPNIDGILLQHPSPSQIDERAAFDRISFRKDVDGVTTLSFGKLSMGVETYLPCTPYGIVLLLKEHGINVSGKNAVVVGRSPILGKPMAMLLTEMNATVTLCHSKTQNLPEIVRRADIVVGAVGKPEFIKADWISKGAVLLDAGYSPGNVGDIEISKAKNHSSFYTPVPGGVGPMTIAVLLLQTLYSSKEHFTPPVQ